MCLDSDKPIIGLAICVLVHVFVGYTLQHVHMEVIGRLPNTTRVETTAVQRSQYHLLNTYVSCMVTIPNDTLARYPAGQLGLKKKLIQYRYLGRNISTSTKTFINDRVK